MDESSGCVNALIFRQHAVRRMFERSISIAEVKSALASGRIIEDYPDDTPYPSCLWLGYAGRRPLHIVYADNAGRILTLGECRMGN